ncbi:MAG: sulfotransferase family protein, partial [Acidimicrobiales bacterium]
MRGSLRKTDQKDFPPGPWLFMVGMHRSGTSALTGALGHLGLQLPDPQDLMTGMEDNPVHYESQALSEVDDSLLAALGGSWSAPPVLEAGWERSPAALSHLERARSAAWRAFPLNGPIAFKDPRLCLLLPFWRPQLQPRAQALLVWRSPLAVARSLRARQNFTISLGLALWEVYARGVLEGLEGLEVTVLPFERVLEDPSGVIGRTADWLVRTGCLERPPTDGELGAAVSS